MMPPFNVISRAWKVIVVGIECNSEEGPHQKLFFQGIFRTSASKMTNCIIVDFRECGSTLYVGFARAVPPTNTNFRLSFLLTRPQEALYEDLAV